MLPTRKDSVPCAKQDRTASRFAARECQGKLSLNILRSQVPQFATQQECEAAQVCAHPNGTYSLLPDGVCQTVGQCSHYCPARCDGTDLCYHTDAATCATDGGVWHSNYAICVFSGVPQSQCQAKGWIFKVLHLSFTCLALTKPPPRSELWYHPFRPVPELSIRMEQHLLSFPGVDAVHPQLPSPVRFSQRMRRDRLMHGPTVSPEIGCLCSHVRPEVAPPRQPSLTGWLFRYGGCVYMQNPNTLLNFQLPTCPTNMEKVPK